MFTTHMIRLRQYFVAVSLAFGVSTLTWIAAYLLIKGIESGVTILGDPLTMSQQMLVMSPIFLVNLLITAPGIIVAVFHRVVMMRRYRLKYHTLWLTIWTFVTYAVWFWLGFYYLQMITGEGVVHSYEPAGFFIHQLMVFFLYTIPTYLLLIR